jgi:hypothetical protein
MQWKIYCSTEHCNGGYTAVLNIAMENIYSSTEHCKGGYTAVLNIAVEDIQQY